MHDTKRVQLSELLADLDNGNRDIKRTAFKEVESFLAQEKIGFVDVGQMILEPASRTERPKRKKIGAIIAMIDSPHRTEARTAWQAVTKLLSKEGLGWADIGRMVSAGASLDGISRKKEGSGRQTRKDGEERPETTRGAVTAEPRGSREDVLRMNERERILHDATIHLVVRKGETERLDGWGKGMGCDRMPETVRSAVSLAYPLPRTITEAKAEFDYWEGRMDDIQVFECCDFDIPVSARLTLVTDLLETRLRARSLDELEIRLHCSHYRGEARRPDEEHAILEDIRALKLLSAATGTAIVKDARPDGKTPIRMIR